jgi:hypothetical protein
LSVVGFIPATARPDTEALAIAFGRSTGAGQRAGVTGTGHTVEWPFILFGDVFLAVPSRGIGRSEGIKAGIGAHGSISLATEGLDATGGRSADRDTATALEELSNQLVSLGLDFTLVHGLSFSLYGVHTKGSMEYSNQKRHNILAKIYHRSNNITLP